MSSQVFYDMHQTPLEGPLERGRRWELEYREWRAEADRQYVQRVAGELTKLVCQSPDVRAAIRESFHKADASFRRDRRERRLARLGFEPLRPWWLIG
jgi:hypothetical protein